MLNSLPTAASRSSTIPDDAATKNVQKLEHNNYTNDEAVAVALWVLRPTSRPLHIIPLQYNRDIEPGHGWRGSKQSHKARYLFDAMGYVHLGLLRVALRGVRYNRGCTLYTYVLHTVTCRM